MANQLKLQIQGLYNTENQFSAVPPGSLEIAENIVIDYPSVAQSRRGFSKHLSASAQVNAITEFNDVIHATINDTLNRENAGVFTAYSGSITPPAGFRNRFAEANEALYFTTETGIKKIFSVGGTITQAGVPRALDGVATAAQNVDFLPGDVNTTDDRIAVTGFQTGTKVQFSTTGGLPGGLAVSTDYWLNRFDANNVSVYDTFANAQAGGATGLINLVTSGTGVHTILEQENPFLGAGNQVAYRCLFGYRDANEYLFRGAPSGRTVTANNDLVTVPVGVNFPIPDGITDSYFIQIYRTTQSTASPNDEMFLLVEIPITSALISAGEVLYFDQTPDSSLGEALYTNASQQGILSANDEPPIATDISVYKGYSIYSNTKKKESLITQLIEVQAVDTTVTIGAEVYTAKTTENAASKFFQVFTTGEDFENIRNTASSLVRMINTGSSSYYAYYLSVGDPEGIILIQGRTFSTAQFIFNSNSPSSYTPTPPTGGVTSDAETRVNRLYYSKPQQPDAVPSGQFFEVGSPNKAILRVLSLRDSAYVLKEDGIFRIVGDIFENMRISIFDRTTVIAGSETAVVADNTIILNSNKGVVAISDNGMTAIGDSIEADIIVAAQNANFDSLAFGLSDEINKRYIIYYPSNGGDVQATKAFVFSTSTNAWTSWTFPCNCGYISSRMYLGGVDTFDDYWLYKERQDFALSDYVDHSFTGEIVSIDRVLNTMTLRTTDVSFMKEGMQILQGRGKAEVLTIQAGDTVSVELLTDDFYVNRDFESTDIDPVLYTVSLPSHGYETGDTFKLRTTGTLPTPLAINTIYFIIVIDENTIQFAASAADSVTGTPITIADDGSGVHTIISGSCTIAEPISVRVAWNPIDGGDPSTVKHFQICNFLFGNSTFENLRGFFRTSFSPQTEILRIANETGGQPWGRFPWGLVPWGDTFAADRVIQTYIPLEKRRGTWLYAGYQISEAFSDIQARGLTIGMAETGDTFR